MRGMDTPPPMVKKPLPLWAKLVLIAISLLFIAGGAVNDGMTGWFLALPFLFILYYYLPQERKQKIVICLGTFFAMVCISHFMWTSRIIFPIIGQEVTVNSQLPLITYQGEHTEYDLYSDSNIESLPFRPSTKASIPQGTALFVVGVAQEAIELSTIPIFILSDGTQKIYITAYGGLGDIRRVREDGRSFCQKVTWDYCSTKENDHSIDFMRPPFRWLASLMDFRALLLFGLYYLYIYRKYN